MREAMKTQCRARRRFDAADGLVAPRPREQRSVRRRQLVLAPESPDAQPPAMEGAHRVEHRPPRDMASRPTTLEELAFADDTERERRVVRLCAANVGNARFRKRCENALTAFFDDDDPELRDAAAQRSPRSPRTATRG